MTAVGDLVRLVLFLLVLIDHGCPSSTDILLQDTSRQLFQALLNRQSLETEWVHRLDSMTRESSLELFQINLIVQAEDANLAFVECRLLMDEDDLLIDEARDHAVAADPAA
jgi:hypothetical protein